MRLAELLDVRPGGVTAVIGGGGKTTLLRTLGEELAAGGARVLLCATTKIFPFEGLPNLLNPSEEALTEALASGGLVCAGTPVPGTGKLTAPSIPMARLAALADYVLAEADGSRGLPVKAHLPYEPVIPAEAGLTVVLIGASGFGRPIREAVHRWERFCAMTGAPPDAPVTAADLAGALAAEGLGDLVFVNQAETPERMAEAKRLAALLDRPVFAGTLRGGVWECLS